VITIHEMSLRDGMHPKQHQISIDEMVTVASALDRAGVPLIEVTHGDGLGGASINYGFPAHSDEEYLRAVVPQMTQARISALTLPGIGTIDDLKMAVDCGVTCLRVATHCTEADVAVQHIGMSRELGVETVGFLMMAHMVSPEELLRQAKIMEDFGAQILYCTDSAGYLLPDGVTERIAALRGGLNPATEVGFHGHHNLAMASPTPWPRSRPAPTASTRRARASGPARATRRPRSWSPCSTAWASTQASISTACRTSPRT